MHIVFYKTNDVFVAEEILQGKGITTKILPTPVQDKAYCGVCVYVRNADLEVVKSAIDGMDFIVI